MPKKDYELIAHSIKESTLDALQFGIDNESVKETATHIANNLSFALGRDNPRFDRQKFLEACGVEQKPTYTGVSPRRDESGNWTA